MTPRREWFCEYEKYDGGNGFLGDDSTTRIIGRVKVKLRLTDGRIRKLPSVLHIPGLARNLIFVRKMGNPVVKTVFEKETYRLIQGQMMLLKGVRFGTQYNMQGITISDGCNSSIVSEIGAKEENKSYIL